MDLRSSNPYWLLKNGLISNYPSLDQHTKADIVVMGAGITGALCAWHLTRAGFSVIVCDKRHVGMGSTAASTALLQYEIDTPLRDLIKLTGEKKAVRSYELCAYAIEAVEKISTNFSGKAGFKYRPSLQYASYKKHVDDLKKEYRLRRQHGFRVSWWDEATFSDKISFDAPAGIYSQLGAELDAYRLTHHLLEAILKKGARIYDNTTITAINHRKKSVELLTAQGFTIKASQLVIACGYESQNYIPQQVETLHSTYAIVSEPLPEYQQFWHRNCLIWETATPYLYLRTTHDKRILIGGLDDDFYSPEKRDSRIPQKARQLTDNFQKKFPEIPFQADFQWAGTFASTKDGLPYIGQIRQRPNTWFALGFGGNGITFSVLAAEQITAALGGKPDPDMQIFSFNR